MESVYSNIGHDINVFIVDNASCEDEFKKLESIARNYPSVRIIRSNINLGYFAGLNEGIKSAKAADPSIKWFVVGNNDLEISGDFCSTLEELSENLGIYSIISPDVVSLDGLHQNPHVIDKVHWIRGFIYKAYFLNYFLGSTISTIARALGAIARRNDMDQWRRPQKITQGHGSCYILSPKFFEVYQSLWAPTFMMGEEYFLAYQMNEKADKIFYNPELKVLHHVHGALSAVPKRKRWEMEKIAHNLEKQYKLK